MGIITAKSNDPLYRLDQIYDDIYSSKYPNAASVMNDPLRGPLQNLYDCNLNMYDTHKIQFAKPQGIGVVNTGVSILEPETFYVYEGDGDKVLFPKESIFVPGLMEITGVYPEGILIGLLDCKLRDKEYRKEHPYTLYSQMLYLARSYIRVNYGFSVLDYPNSKYGHGYGTYLHTLPEYFAIKKLIDSDITAEEFERDLDTALPSDTEYIFKDKDNFLKVMNSYNYEKIYKYFMNVPQIVFDKEPVITATGTFIPRDNSKYHREDYYSKDNDPMLGFGGYDYSEEKVDNPNNEFEDKYKDLRKEEIKENEKALKQISEDIISDLLDNSSKKTNKSSEEIIDYILDANSMKFKNDLDEDKNPKPGREFHVYMYNCFEDEDLDEIGLCIDAKSTKTQLDIQANYIYTTNTHYVSTDLIRRGYRIFIHMDKDRVYEIKIGENDWTDREIKWAHKLETFLYNGEMK